MTSTDGEAEQLSACHRAPVRIDGDQAEGTHFYVCTKCLYPCDLYVADKQTDEAGNILWRLRSKQIGYHEAKTRMTALLAKAERRGIKKATGGYYYEMPIKSMRSRNTAFKLYAVKFFNGEIKKRRERLLAALQAEEAGDD